MLGDRYGTHRVIIPRSPAVALPQASWKLDNDTGKVFDNELLIDVERLNIDSASFVQMESVGEVSKQILETVAERGKQHNRVTGSGGMLLGRVARVGGALVTNTQVGDRVATLVSLTLTPLRLDRIVSVNPVKHQVDVEGQAILFESGAWAKMPSDFPESVALAALDAAGAAPQVAHLVRPGHRVLILGAGGKSGLMCAAAARRSGAVMVVGVERTDAAAAAARRLGACHAVLVADAADAVRVAEAAIAAGGGEFDLTVSCVNLPDAEMGAVLATRDGGTVYFFSMATQFTKATLGAEGVSKDVSLMMGNGYRPGHAEDTLALIRSEPVLKDIFWERYG